MSKYIVLSKLNSNGLKTVRDDPDRIHQAERDITAHDGKLLQQWALLGEYDFLSIVDAPDNRAIHQIEVDRGASGNVQYTVLPAIDLPVFIRLLGQTTETVGPYTWQISWWARGVRRLMRNSQIYKPVKEWFKPIEVIGRENLDGFKEPCIVIANHSSHLDGPALNFALPGWLQSKLAPGGAADRWFLKGRKGIRKQPWYGSLTGNSWPIHRGGGRASLAYGEWLIDKGWSLLIFPEGTRATTHKMGHFKNGVAMIATAKNVPVVPVYMEGLRAIRPKNTTVNTPGPVTVVVGKPIRFAPGTEVSAATRQMYEVMMQLQAHARAMHPRTERIPEGIPAAASAAGGG